MLDDDETVHRIVVTVRAVSRESQNRKIEYFARLLTEAGLGNALSVDQYDEFADILEALSSRELVALLLLDEIERANRHLAGNSVQRTNQYWKEFRDKLMEAGVPQDELAGLWSRLPRTGLYMELTGTYLNYTGGQGVLTGTWDKFRLYVIDRDLNRREVDQAGS